MIAPVNTIDATVVVCTYNRAALLRDALASLASIETGGRFQYEVLVVDNGSTDDTNRVIEEMACRATVPIRTVRETRKGVASARNRGINDARGRWIAFFDDDQVAEPSWLAALMSTARQTGARVVGGAVELRLTEQERLALPPVCRNLLGEFLPSESPCPYSRHVAAGTGNVLIARDVFDQIGCFDESLREAGEDTDLNRRIRQANIKAWYTPRAIVHHVVPPHRLEEEYFRWSSLRNAGHIARRERGQLGSWLFPLMLIARIGQGALVFAPRLAWARLWRDGQAALGARCLLWRIEGYTRWSLRLMAPRLFTQREFISRLDFRAERRTLTTERGQ